MADRKLPARFGIKKLATLLGGAGVLLSSHAHADTTTIPTAAAVTATHAYLPDVARLEAVSYRLSRASSDLCERPQMLSGLLLHDLGGFSAQTRPAAIRAYGLGFGFGVTHVLADSPAGGAGIEVGDEIVSVNGADVTTFARDAIGRRPSYARTEAFNKLLDAALRLGPAQLALRRGQTTVEVTIYQESGCGGTAVVQRQKTLNAFSNGRHVAVTSTMMRFVDSDAELAFVVAHEMAHNILHHTSRRQRTANVHALLADSVKGKKSAEIEADELAVQLMARAGYDLDAPPRFFGRVKNVRRVGLSLTHPSSSRRVRLVSAVIARIEGDKSQGRQGTYLARRITPDFIGQFNGKRYDVPVAYAKWRSSSGVSHHSSANCVVADFAANVVGRPRMGMLQTTDWGITSRISISGRVAHNASPAISPFRAFSVRQAGCRAPLQSLVGPGLPLARLFVPGEGSRH